jgi:hypothetical protein
LEYLQQRQQARQHLAPQNPAQEGNLENVQNEPEEEPVDVDLLGGLVQDNANNAEQEVELEEFGNRCGKN